MTEEQEPTVAATTAGEIDDAADVADDAVVVDAEILREELEADFFEVGTTEDEEEAEGTAEGFDPTGFPCE